MTKVTLVRPPFVVSVASAGGPLSPPLGLAYLAGSLRTHGHEVTVVDAVGLGLEKKTPVGKKLILEGIQFPDIVNLIPEDTDLIGFSGMFSSDWVIIKPLVNMIGEKFKDKYFIAGGEHFTAAPEISLDQCKDLDAIGIGEGEETIKEIADAIDSKSSWKNIAGLVLREKENDKYIKTPARKRMMHLDEIPLPAWDLLPLNNYLDAGMSHGVHLGRSIAMLASRGCPFQCTFCSSPSMWGTRWLSRDTKKLVDEIEKYIKEYRISNVDFYDLTAIVKKSWIIEFCKELLNRNINITWQLPSGTRSEAIDGEVAELLYKSGCRQLSYAPESGSEKSLMLIKKKVKLDRMIKSVTSTVKAGVSVKVNFMIGFPHETHKDVLLTFWYMLRCSLVGVSDFSLTIFSPYPGSELYDELVEKGKIKHDDDYWEQLSYADMSETRSYCENLSARWLLFYNWLGYAISYSSSYLFRPIRIYKTVRNIISNKQETRGDLIFSLVIKRIIFKLGFSKKSS